MLYVHVAETHARELPEKIREAAIGEADPDARIVKMLGARGSHVAASARGVEETPVNLAS
jgi:hypothetical protein